MSSRDSSSIVAGLQCWRACMFCAGRSPLAAGDTAQTASDAASGHAEHAAAPSAIGNERNEHDDSVICSRSGSVQCGLQRQRDGMINSALSMNLAATILHTNYVW